MKKIVPLALSAFLLGTMTVGAEQPLNKEGAEQIVKEAAFAKYSGEITEVKQLETSKLYTAEVGENIFHFHVGDKTLVFDQQGNEVELQVGDTTSIFIFANQPMILIYPPQYSPAVVIVEKEDAAGSVKVAQFDENLLSDDGELKLKLDGKTEIVNTKGEKVDAKDLKKYNAAVFYGPTTKSIPAQTSPEKIVVFPKLEDAEEVETPEIAPEIQAIIGRDYKEVDGKIMVPLRLVAEELGFKVTSTGKGAILSKGALSYTVTRGEKAYGHNRALNYFEIAPELLEDNKTYVELSFAQELIQ